MLMLHKPDLQLQRGRSQRETKAIAVLYQDLHELFPVTRIPARILNLKMFMSKVLVEAS